MDDLDLVVELINSRWVLADPPDRLSRIDYYRDVLVRCGEAQLADELNPADLDRLRTFRERLRAVFHAPSENAAVALVNTLLRQANVIPQLTSKIDGDLTISWAASRHGLEALAARLPGALAEHIANHRMRRLGVCAATPCDAVFVDRTRPKTRKYCCDQCNDRAAAAAYYQRHRGRPDQS